MHRTRTVDGSSVYMLYPSDVSTDVWDSLGRSEFCVVEGIHRTAGCDGNVVEHPLLLIRKVKWTTFQVHFYPEVFQL
jgi:hypothetical protein